ncbi:hypothetical protein FAGKG844_340019 [Frankia sp. AgKG'84/4]
MNGAPAKPISGVPPSSPSRLRTASVTYGTSSGSSARSAPRPAPSRTGSATTGPTPGTMSTSRPIATSGTTMSEKKIAASGRNRRTGCMVISVISAGSRHESSIPTRVRRSRYSGRTRPAWRMNHTGVVSGRSPRQARRKGAVVARPARRARAPAPVDAGPVRLGTARFTAAARDPARTGAVVTKAGPDSGPASMGTTDMARSLHARRTCAGAAGVTSTGTGR